MSNSVAMTSDARQHGLWAASTAQAVLPYVVTGLALVAAVLILGEDVGHHIRRMEGRIEGLGPAAIFAFALLYAVASSIFVPDTLLGIVAGASFGFTRGLAAAAMGSVVGAMLQFAISRYFARPAIRRMVATRPTLLRIQSAVLTRELKLQCLIRLTPLNRALTSYALGAAGVSFGKFLLSLVALLPTLCLEVYFGYAGKHLAKVTSGAVHPMLLHDVTLAAGLVVAATVMVIVSREARRAVQAATLVVADAEGVPT
jgi:uncharacterized membrane protein YdjX (TVP38/TMEM64 family)